MLSVYRPGSIRIRSGENRSERRRRESDRIKSIAAALDQAGDALGEWTAARELDAARDSRNNSRNEEMISAHLDKLKRAHLRDCVRLAEEMQRTLSLTLGDWVLGDDIAGTGLSNRELALLRAVAGYEE